MCHVLVIEDDWMLAEHVAGSCQTNVAVRAARW